MLYGHSRARRRAAALAEETRIPWIVYRVSGKKSEVLPLAGMGKEETQRAFQPANIFSWAEVYMPNGKIVRI